MLHMQNSDQFLPTISDYVKATIKEDIKPNTASFGIALGALTIGLAGGAASGLTSLSLFGACYKGYPYIIAGLKQASEIIKFLSPDLADLAEELSIHNAFRHM